jgi:lysophospholipase L1-like esterase
MKPSPIQLFIVSGLFLSFLANILLFGASLHYYRLLSKVKLDPLGLNSLQPNFNPTYKGDSQLSVAFLGDSRALSWPQPSTSLPLTFTNLGVSGHTTSQTLLRFRHFLANNDAPDIIVIQAGINDLKTIPIFPAQREEIVSNCQRNLANLVSLSVNSGAVVVISTIFPVGNISPIRAPLWPREVDEAILKCNNSIRLLSSDRVHVLESSDILADPQGRIYKQYQKNFLHLNSFGYRRLNEILLPMLVRITKLAS